MNFKDVKKGALLSYALIIINTLYGLFFTPYLISVLGDGEYGVYKIMGSLIGSMTVLDLGIGSTVLRFSAKFYAEEKKRELDNFSAMGMIEASIISGIMVVVSIIAYFNIDRIYGASLNSLELAKAKELFILFAVLLVLNTYEKVLFSLISGCAHYTFANGLKLLRILLKLVLSYMILNLVADSRVLLVIEIVLLLIIMIVQLFYLRNNVGIIIHLYKWENPLFLGTFKYTVLMFIQSMVVQFNGNLDNMVIGAVIGSTAVAVYSIGLQLYNMYEQFALAFSDLMLPIVSKQIADGASTIQLEDTVIKVGRLEFMALGGALCGFTVIGKEFITLWLGEGYLFAWTVGIILMIPTTIPLIQNVCLSILRAKNKMGFRTAAVVFMAIFNLIVTILGVPKYGPIAACIGTVIGLVCANIIAMNIYYVRVLKLNVARIFAQILSRTWVCCIAATVCLLIVNMALSGSWALWLIKVICFILVYGAMLFAYGFQDKEKQLIIDAVQNILRRR